MKLIVPAMSLTMAFALNLTHAESGSNVSDVETKNVVEEVHVTGVLSRYGATKSAIPIIETESLFRDKGALSLDDTLAYTSGVVGDTFGFSTRGDFPKVRGLDAAEYRDGQQVLFGFYNNTRSDIYMLEQVEILKGPASVLYGKGTPGGIVNAISKIAGPDHENELVLDIGSQERYQGAVDYNLDLSESLFLRVVGVYRDSGTQVDFVDDNASIVMPSLTYQTEKSSVTAMLEIVDRESDSAHQFLPLTGTGCVSSEVSISGGMSCVSESGRRLDAARYLGEPDFNRYDTESNSVSVLGSHAFSDALSIEGVARYKDATVDYRQVWMSFAGDGNPRVNANGDGFRTWYQSDASSEQAALDLRLRWNIQTGIFQHEFLAGFAYQDVTVDNNTLFLPALDTQNIYRPIYGRIPAAFNGSVALTDGPETTTTDVAFYLNDQISVGSFKINLGFRHDETESSATGAPAQDDDATTMSIGLLYAFDSGLSPYISYAESFEPVIGTDGLTNQTLKPREGEQTELGIKYQPFHSNTSITLAYFDIEESNLPNPSSLIDQPDSQQEGIGSVSGFELEALTQVGDWFIEANVSVIDTETADGKAFESIPEEQASAWVQYQPSSGLLNNARVGVGLRYAGESESNGNNAVLGPFTVVTDGYVLGDLLLAYVINDVDLSLNIRNITDEEYYGTCLARGDCFPGEERSVVARIAYGF